MFKRIFRAIDLSFCVSARARESVIAARASGIPVAVMYDGGLEVTASEIIHHFRRGKPTAATPGEVFVVGRVRECGELRVRRALHAQAEGGDTWMWFEYDGLGRRYEIDKRRDTDVWLSEVDYLEAFAAAARALN
jgi:hypothetical protein